MHPFVAAICFHLGHRPDSVLEHTSGIAAHVKVFSEVEMIANGGIDVRVNKAA
jgi:hypothetical protein